MKRMFSKEDVSFALDLYEKCKSTRIVGKALGCDHTVAAKLLRANGAVILSKSENAKYTWKNHKHPYIGKKGELCPQYGKRMSAQTREKMEKIWKSTAEKIRIGRKQCNGYVWIYKPNHPNADKSGYVAEHRFVAGEMVGRPLTKNDIVHHINGIKTDNRPENLMVLSRSEHAKLHSDLRKEK